MVRSSSRTEWERNRGMGVSPPPVEPTIDPKSIKGLKYFSALSDLLARLRDVGTARDKAGNRDLFFDRYVSLILLYFFNPTLTGVRSIQAASQLEKVQKAFGCQKTSLGSFSEAGRGFDARSLKTDLAQIAPRVEAVAGGGEFGGGAHFGR